jgi:Zn-dependent M28 family amino/carboxypeptidase
VRRPIWARIVAERLDGPPEGSYEASMLKPVLFAAALVLLADAALAAPQVGGIDAQRLSQHVKVLAGDDFEGRGPATEGETKTLAYLIAQFRTVGLQPAGDLQKDGKRAWTQAAPLARFEISGPVQASFGVEGRAEPVTQGQEVAIRAPQTNVDRVDVKDAPIVFAGYGVAAPERNWDDFKGVDVKGKMLMVLVNDPDFETGVGDFGGKAMTYYGRWTYKYEEAARRGALGVFVVHETAPAAYGWATVRNSDVDALFDIVRAKPSDSHPLVEAWIQRDEAAALLKAAGQDFEALKTAAQTRAFRPVELKGVTFSTAFKVDHAVITSHNVAARRPGTRHPDETVIYSAHWDHLGVGQPDATGDRIYHGAVDNALGTASLLELARAFAKAPPTDRSVLFLSVTAEEKNLLGSEYYATHPLYPLGKTVAAINMDGGSTVGKSRDMTSSGDAQNDLQTRLADALKAEGRYYTPDPQPEAGHFYRSDHFTLAKVGVPSISVGQGQDLLVGGVAAGKAARDAYTRDRYHQPADKWSASWDLSGQVQNLELLYRMGRDLASSRDWPGWQASSEFKPARDRSAADRR